MYYNEELIRQFLKERFANYREDLGITDPLDGIVDSLGFYELVSFVEKEFSISIPNEDFSPQFFSSIENIIKTIEKFQEWLICFFII